MSDASEHTLQRNIYHLIRAHDVALSKQHKSISASDVLKALEMIEFGDLVGVLQNELQGECTTEVDVCVLY